MPSIAHQTAPVQVDRQRSQLHVSQVQRTDAVVFGSRRGLLEFGPQQRGLDRSEVVGVDLYVEEAIEDFAASVGLLGGGGAGVEDGGEG